MNIAGLIIALGFSAISAAGSGADAWRYVVPAPGDPFERPPLRAVGLVSEKPDDLAIKVNFRGTRQRYARLRYGSPSSVRVTVVVDELGPGSADLYVDANRSLRIDAKDLLAGNDRTWRVPLDAEIVEGENTRRVPRIVFFRLGATGTIVSHATGGYLEGTVDFAGSRHTVRRMDADANGLFTDAHDRVWIDLNDDGRWDPSSEQFLFAPILTIGGVRYAMRSDQYGENLTAKRLEGSGTVSLALANRGMGRAAREVFATLIGRDGSAVGLAGEHVDVTVPTGEYRLGTVTCSFDDPDGGARWSFVFCDMGRRGEPRWYKVVKGGSVVIDPIGELVFEAGIEGAARARPGDDLRIQPRLYTGDGLLIVTCYRGMVASPGGDTGSRATIAVSDATGRTHDRTHSGFA